MPKISSKYIFLSLLIGIFFAQFFFISPKGEFALNDDWVHAEIIKHWSDTGEFRMPPFAGPTFYLPILYGTALIKIFGFSFFILRLSTLFFSLATAVIFYFFLNHASQNHKMSFFGALTLLFNPIFYNLSFTFMTDVPALFFIVSSIYAYYLGFEKNNNNYILIGGLLAVTGFFIRQTNILVMIAAGIFALTQLKNISFKQLLIAFGIPAIIWLLTCYFLFSNNLLPQSADSHIISSARNLIRHILWWVWYIVVYLGLFIAPFFIGWSIKNMSEFKKIKLIIPILAAALAVVLIYFFAKEYFPYIPNIINKTGLGPMGSVMNGDMAPLFTKKVWGILSLLFAFSGAWIITRLKYATKNNNRPNIFLVTACALFLLPILFLESFDRYFLPIYAMALAILLPYLDKKMSWVGIIFTLTVYAVFSVSQTAFYLNWNRARWELADDAKQLVAAANQIDAGYEWNGWNSYWSAVNSGLLEGTKTSPWWIRDIFVNNTEDYIVAFSPIRPYAVVKFIEVKGLNKNNKIYLLKKPL